MILYDVSTAVCKRRVFFPRAPDVTLNIVVIRESPPPASIFQAVDLRGRNSNCSTAKRIYSFISLKKKRATFSKFWLFRKQKGLYLRRLLSKEFPFRCLLLLDFGLEQDECSIHRSWWKSTWVVFRVFKLNFVFAFVFGFVWKYWTNLIVKQNKSHVFVQALAI